MHVACGNGTMQIERFLSENAVLTEAAMAGSCRYVAMLCMAHASPTGV